MPPEARSVSLNLSSRELIFLQKVTRQEYHFITDDEQEARLRLRDKLLEGFFDQNESRIVLNLTRDELLNEVWGYNAMPSTRTVDVHVAWLRQKIEPNPRHPQFVLTVHGLGYKFVG